MPKRKELFPQVAAARVPELHYEPMQVALLLNCHKNTILRNLTSWFPNAIKFGANEVRIPSGDVVKFTENARILQKQEVQA